MIRKVFNRYPRIPVRIALVLTYKLCEGTSIRAYMGHAFQNSEDRLAYIWSHFWLNDTPIFASLFPFGRKWRI